MEDLWLKMEEMKQSIIRTRTEIEELDTEHPEFIETYREKYMSAREEAGIKEDDNNSFLQFIYRVHELDDKCKLNCNSNCGWRKYFFCY